MKEIRKVRFDYNDLVKKIDDLGEVIALYHDQPLTIDRASGYLGIKKSTLYHWTHQKKIPHFKTSSRKVFFSRLELNKWAFMHKVLTMEEIDSKANQYVFWGKRDWEYQDYELIYKQK